MQAGVKTDPGDVSQDLAAVPPPRASFGLAGPIRENLRRGYRNGALMAGVAGIYYLGAKLGLACFSPEVKAAAVWPPAGLMLATVILFGYRIWPGVLLGAFLSAMSFPRWNGCGLGTLAAWAAWMAVGAGLGALAGGWLARRLAGGRAVFHRTQSLLWLLLFVAPLSAAISASLGVLGLRVMGLESTRSGLLYAALTAWLGNTASSIVLTPLILAWSTTRWPQLSARRVLEAVTMLAGMALAGRWVFGNGLPSGMPAAVGLCFTAAVLVWPAVRFGLRGTTAAVVVLTGFGVFGAAHGAGLFGGQGRAMALLMVQQAAVGAAVFSLALATETLQRRRSQSALAAAQTEIARLNAEAERRIGQRTAQLEAINKELEAFSYSVSHDLRAPLRSIRGFSEVMLERYSDKLDGRGQDFLRRVCESTQHMDRLIEDLLMLSRVGRSELLRQPVDLSALALSIAAELLKNEPERAVEFAIAPQLTAKGDERLLRTVLENLLRNAWKFTGHQPRPCIEFGFTTHPQAAFFVRDNGAGFDMTYAGNLFRVFHRLHSASEFPGTGVGLAIVQRIINRHGGRVWASGAVSEGATFYFTLPIEGAM